ncbi:MAG TPA: M23 family metallopeptidase [Puia sp.]|nr:M23 family metallopeptidase [Puia sp.]
MKNLCLLLLASLAYLTSPAQRLLTVNYTTDNQNRYIFTCTNNDYCPYVVQVDFPTLTNAQADHPLPYTTEVKPGTVRLITVSPIDKTKDIKLNFKTSNRKGVLNPVVNLHFVYLLPITPGIETQAYRVTNVKGSATPGAQDTGYAIRLRAKPGDTIYAARRGVVTAVDVSNTENDAGANATNGWNYIEVYHADNSFAQYGVIQKDGAFVHPGQTVEAGTPIGLVGGDRYGRGAEVRFSVSWYPGVPNTNIPLVFWTKDNGKGALRHGADYTSEFPKAILNQELPRKKTPARKPGVHRR